MKIQALRDHLAGGLWHHPHEYAYLSKEGSVYCRECVSDNVKKFKHQKEIVSIVLDESDTCGGISCRDCRATILTHNGCYGDGINPFGKPSDREPCDNCAEALQT